MQIPAVRRYVEWRGGRVFEALRSTHRSGHVLDAGLDGEQEFWETKRGIYWEQEKTGSIVTSVAVSGRNNWRTNLSGQPIPLSSNEIRNYQREAALMFAGIFRDDLGATVQALPNETFDGSMCSVFRVSFGDADSYDFFVDPDSGRLETIRATVDRRRSFTVYSHWKSVSGVQEPFCQELRTTNQASERSFDAQTIALEQTPPKPLFDKLRDSVQLDFSKDSHSSGWIVFNFVDGKRLFIPGEINGQRVMLLLDSGAETTVLGKDLAGGSGITCSGRIGVEGSGGSDSGSLCTGVSIQLGNAVIKGITATQMDLEAIGRAVNVPIAAILGQEIFNSTVVDIDFKQNRIAFRDSTHFSPPRGVRRLSLMPFAGNRVLHVSIEGKSPIPVIFDLGNGSALDVFPSYWKPMHMLDGRIVHGIPNGWKWKQETRFGLSG